MTKEAAREPLDAVSLPGTGLIIGAGGNFQPATFFSGLVDDVRVYNRAVAP